MGSARERVENFGHFSARLMLLALEVPDRSPVLPNQPGRQCRYD